MVLLFDCVGVGKSRICWVYIIGLIYLIINVFIYIFILFIFYYIIIFISFRYYSPVFYDDVIAYINL